MADPDLCRWGKLNDRQTYGVIAVDLDRLLARADFTKFEQILMQYIRERSWGDSRRQGRGVDGRWPDPIAVPLSMGDVAAELGVVRQRLAGARRSLLDSLILIQTPEGFLINKGMSVSPRFSKGDVEYAALAWRGSRPAAQPRSTPKQATPNDIVDPNLERGYVQSLNADTFNSERGYVQDLNADTFKPERGYVQAPIEERAAEHLNSHLKNNQTQDSGARVGGVSAAPEAGPPEPAPSRPIPPGLDAVARQADAISALAPRQSGFAQRLRSAWHRGDGNLDAAWSLYPDSPAWLEALGPLAGAAAREIARGNAAPEVSYYLGIVKRLARDASTAAIKARPAPIVYHTAPPKLASDQDVQPMWPRPGLRIAGGDE